MRWPLRAAVGLAFALAGCACPRIRQIFVIDAQPDADLQTLIDTCIARSPNGPISASLACVPLCQRVLEISNQFSGGESIEECGYRPPAAGAFDAGSPGGGQVEVTYRRNSC